MKNPRQLALKRKCVVCGEWFAPKAGRQKCCSAVCSAKKDQAYKREQGKRRPHRGVYMQRWSTYALHRAQAMRRTEGVTEAGVLAAAREAMG